MASKRKDSIPLSVNYITETPRSWYLDIYNPGGFKLHRVHVFISSPGNDEAFEDCGQVKSVCVSQADLQPEIECLDVEVAGLEYQLLPQAYKPDKMVSNKEGDMFSRGWHLGVPINEVTADNLHDAIIGPLKFKGQKSIVKQDKITLPKSKRRKSDSNIVEVSKIGTGEGSSSKNIVDPKALEKEAKKAKDKATGGMEQYSNYFPFKYKDFEIPVEHCWLAPDHYVSRVFERKTMISRMLDFSSSRNRPASCAYLMPIKNHGAKKGERMKKEEVIESKLQQYHYWIIDGQHSIYAAKALRDSDLETYSASLKEVYEFRSARIIVDAEPRITVPISRIANNEAQALYIKQDLSDILMHLRSQWIYAKRPARPSPGVKQGSESRSQYDEFLHLAETSVGAAFLAKQGHMVTYSDEVFKVWLDLIKGLEEGTIEGRKPNATHFRCLSGLDEDNVKKIQDAIKANQIVLIKGPKDNDMKDMAEFVRQLKQDKIIQDELMKVFKEADKDKDFQSWSQIVDVYKIDDHVYQVLLKMCDFWIKAKLAASKVTPEFPLKARAYIDWITKLNKVQLSTTSDIPWKIHAVNLHMEGEFFLSRYYQHPISIGLCILDSTEGSAKTMQWSESIFIELLSGIMSITGGTVHAQYVLLAFLTFDDVMHLKEALKKVGRWHKLFMGGLHYVEEAPCIGGIELLSVLVFVSQDDCFEGYSELNNTRLVLDAGFFELPYDSVKDLSAIDFLRKKKDLLINDCIMKYCMGDLRLVDIFSNGYVSEKGLLYKRDTICLVQSIQECQDVDTKLLEIVKLNSDIRQWAGIPEEQPVEESQLEETTTEPSKISEDDIEAAARKLFQNESLGTSDKSFTHIAPREFATEFVEEATICDNENLLCQVKAMVADNESSSVEVKSQKAMLTVVLDLNGLLLMHSQKPSQFFPSIGISHNTHTILRPGCLEFLKILLERFNVGIWSTANEDNVFRMVRALQKEAGQDLPFFAIWGQHACVANSKTKIFRPDKPNVEAMFKPLARMANGFECDHMRTILIDDSPYKGCASPTNNCIFPTTFDISNEKDNILLGELLPYLIRLDEADDVRTVIESDRYGQLPVVHGHELFTKFADVKDKWIDINMRWSQKRFNTGRLPIAEQLSNTTSATRDKEGQKGASGSRQRPKVTDSEIREILKNAIPSIPTMKGNQLIELAKRLGCGGGVSLRPVTAKAFINRLRQGHGLR